MHSERDYMGDVRVRLQSPATLAILVLNGLVFVVQLVAAHFFPQFPFDERFALSVEGLKSGCVWQLLTYQFMHANFLHIFLNSWAIFMFGPVVEFKLGKTRMLLLYFLSGIAGGLLQIIGGLFFPEQFGEAVVGASAAAFGLVAAFVVCFPEEIFLILPIFVKIRAKTFLWLSIGISVVGACFPFGHIGHAAHLGGIAAGYILARCFVGRSPLVPSANQFCRSTEIR
jgi:membrane associated rhomboid family serine protease